MDIKFVEILISCIVGLMAGAGIAYRIYFLPMKQSFQQVFNHHEHRLEELEKKRESDALLLTEIKTKLDILLEQKKK